MKKILFAALMALSANAAATEYNVVCKWADGTKDVYPNSEVWTAESNDGGTIIILMSREVIKYSTSVQCKIVKEKS